MNLSGQGNIYQGLIESGKQEFLKHGFEKASLRTICKNAGVTTGAFYTYFNKKEDLFNRIVCPVLEEFYSHCDSIINLQYQDCYTNGDSELRSIMFLLNHKEEFLMLFDGAQGTQFENFKEDMLTGFMYEYYQRHLDFHVGKQVDSELVKILLRMKFQQYVHILYGNYSMDEIRRLVTNLTIFTEGGLIKLMDKLQCGDD